MPSPLPAIIFDLDGTLIDSAPDVAVALNRLLQREGRPAVTLAQVQSFVGEGPGPLIERAFAATGSGPAPATLPELIAAYVAFYQEAPADHTLVFPGVREMLAALAGRTRLGLCTNKPDAMVRPVLEALGLADSFTALVGGDFPRRKPDGEHLRETLRRMGLAPDAPAVMVGDSPTDIAAAREAGLPVLVVDFGYSRVPVTELGADRVLSGFADLPAVVAEIIR